MANALRKPMFYPISHIRSNAKIVTLTKTIHGFFNSTKHWDFYNNDYKDVVFYDLTDSVKDEYFIVRKKDERYVFCVYNYKGKYNLLTLLLSILIAGYETKDLEVLDFLEELVKVKNVANTMFDTIALSSFNMTVFTIITIFYFLEKYAILSESVKRCLDNESLKRLYINLQSLGKDPKGLKKYKHRLVYKINNQTKNNNELKIYKGTRNGKLMWGRNDINHFISGLISDYILAKSFMNKERDKYTFFFSDYLKLGYYLKADKLADLYYWGEFIHRAICNRRKGVLEKIHAANYDLQKVLYLDHEYSSMITNSAKFANKGHVCTRLFYYNKVFCGLDDLDHEIITLNEDQDFQTVVTRTVMHFEDYLRDEKNR